MKPPHGTQASVRIHAFTYRESEAGDTSPSDYFTIKETISKATMLMTLIIGLIAGPAVSL